MAAPKKVDASPPAAIQSADILESTAPVLSKPRFFKSKVFPPKTSEEKAMWEWWQAMRKTDESFEWKTPVNFYGKVIDQFGKPVAGAKVTFVLSVVNGTETKEIIANDDGGFELKNARGKGLSVSIFRDGYTALPDAARKSFEYAAFFEDNFIIPDRNRPVVFQLRKIVGAEPIYIYYADGAIKTDGTVLWLDVTKGTVGNNGDVAFRITTDKTQSPGYSVNLETKPGAGLILSEARAETVAPDAAYEQSAFLYHKRDEINYRTTNKFTFFTKTISGNYAKVYVEIALVSEELADFRATIRYNPSGSRNLEFDPKKLLNP